MRLLATVLIMLLLFVLSSALAQPRAMNVFNSTSYTDENGATLQDGDVLHFLWAGPDGQIDPPVMNIGDPNNGQPTGDDALLETHTIGENFPPGFGQFSFTVTTYADHAGGYPAQGDVVYLRAFNDNNTITATFYGDAQLYTVQFVNGENYDPLIDAGSTDTSLPVELSAFSALSGNHEVLLKWTTSSEINNLGFVIYRGPEEAGEYQEISSYKDNENLKGAGSSTVEHKYNLKDIHVQNEVTYWYKLISVDYNGERHEYDPVSVTPNVSAVNRMNIGAIPTKFDLKQNYPNPFNPSTRIEFSVPGKKMVGRTVMLVYDMLGRKVKTLVDAPLEPGFYYVNWDGTNDNGMRLSSGVYIYYLESGYLRDVNKMLLMK